MTVEDTTPERSDYTAILGSLRFLPNEATRQPLRRVLAGKPLSFNRSADTGL